MDTVDSKSLFGIWDVSCSDNTCGMIGNFTLPKTNPPIFVGLTESRHFVVLKMKNENLFPASQLEKKWEQIATPEAMNWKNSYLRCFELNRGLNWRLFLINGIDLSHVRMCDSCRTAVLSTPKYCHPTLLAMESEHFVTPNTMKKLISLAQRVPL
ncbi:hypothetical protein VP01_2887g5 [Puccinia sorghi]|uniref:Uncharacterized protein n=1 Tax=Puccinia sorghi TaxID=27349 RepID=A0A0L6V1N8_9BASI|nr:hypothetical protein VP01_2887g5 [Puccinia sorghi]